MKLSPHGEINTHITLLLLSWHERKTLLKESSYYLSNELFNDLVFTSEPIDLSTVLFAKSGDEVVMP